MRLRNLPVLVDDVGDAARVLVLFRLRRAVSDADLAIGVAQERKGEVEFLRELRVRFAIVEADAEDFGVLLFVLGREVPEPGTFERSAGCGGLRIEPEDDFLSAQIAKPHCVPFVIDDFEVRCDITNIQHARSSENVSQFSSDRHGEILWHGARGMGQC